MLTYLIAFLIALGLSTALIPNIKALARRYQLFDRNLSSRKIHTVPIPRLGGIAIVAGFYAPLLGLLLHTNMISERVYQDPRRIFGLLGGGAAIFCLGFYDDLKGSGAKLKLSVQILVAAAMYAAGFHIDQLAMPFAGHVLLGPLALPFTIFWIVGVINAFNLIDGLDGLAGGVAFFAISTVFLISVLHNDTLMALYMASLGGGIVGFLIFNFNPASIFMGDSGSMFLGFILAVTSIQTSQKSGTAVAMLVPIVSLGLPIMDTLIAMLRRLLTGRSMFQADREHVHHKLLSLGFTHRRAVILLYAFCMFLGAVALAMTFANSQQTALLLIVVAAVVAVLIRKLGFLRAVGENQRSLGVLRERNLQLRARVRSAGESLRRTQGRDELWDCLQTVAPELPGLEIQSLKLELRQQLNDGNTQQTAYSWERRLAGAHGRVTAPQELRLALGGEERGYLLVRLGGITSLSGVDRDQEIALEILCEHLTSSLERFERSASGPRAVLPFRRG